MSQAPVTRMVEDYLTLIWKAYEWPGGEPTTTDMAAQLGVTASSVSANLKKLARDGFIEYEPYGRITLTEIGSQLAIGIVRRHRIIETYLVKQLGLSWDQVHDEADQLEHAVSEVVLARMDEVLGWPTEDPHGDPIPRLEGDTPEPDTVPLLDAQRNVALEVARVSDRSPDVLRYLHARGVTVGARLEVLEVALAVGTVSVAIGSEETGAGQTDITSASAAAIRVRIAR
ncbi:metal-dependent transcriptional regulator [Leucobacter insecticola]|uniref:Manganese transport regulator n=1 Tax=Leucobacter insecticola TaxID=2714934 RepID=A0A6G8FGP2_9MICO|nr:metal-dependent transcriptional regulator [Leucobacter insecticola]QIM15538.1 metal-dependent transcriptional regulator [Leucobacter insecticola]